MGPNKDVGRIRSLLRFVLIAAVCVAAGASEAGTISGIVTGPDGATRLAGIQVVAWRTNLFMWFGTATNTEADGTYSFTGLEEGTYRVEFNEDRSPDFAHETYDDKKLLSEGSNLFVAADSVHANVNASLAVASGIAGHVYGPDGSTGVEGVWVWAYQRDVASRWRRIGEFSTTDASGAFRIGGLAAGPYRVRFNDHELGDYIAQVYSNAGELDSGTDVWLPASGTVSNIDATLGQAGKISGTMLTTNGLPVSNGTVYVYSWKGTYWGSEDSSDCILDDNGQYLVGGLSSGTYRVEFHIRNEHILDEYYDDALEVEYGDDVPVVAGSTASNVDAVLDSPAWPPRIVRQTNSRFLSQVYFTATNDAVCVLQGTDSPANKWIDVATNDATSKGVNSIVNYFPMGTTGYWRIRSASAP